MNQRYSIATIFLVLGLLLGIVLLCQPLLNIIGGNKSATPYLTYFQDIKPETPLEGTDYWIDYSDQNLLLKNSATRETTTIIQHYSPVALKPAYQLLNFQSHVYLLIQLASGGNSGAYWFRVFDVSVSPANDLMVRYDDPNMGHSCTYPILVKNSLRFEIAPDCAASASHFQTYWLDLGLSLTPTSPPTRVVIQGGVQGGGLNRALAANKMALLKLKADRKA